MSANSNINLSSVMLDSYAFSPQNLVASSTGEMETRVDNSTNLVEEDNICLLSTSTEQLLSRRTKQLCEDIDTINHHDDMCIRVNDVLLDMRCDKDVVVQQIKNIDSDNIPELLYEIINKMEMLRRRCNTESKGTRQSISKLKLKIHRLGMGNMSICGAVFILSCVLIGIGTYSILV